ncbi:hypothetical protein IMSHALPRED_002431 [Imshaugia aleurites]|uniref:Uncharacterized protein n=1 Tax=Imshaugia aleurites TaxID=172621 RepID=A0A8H3J5H9_9LECA|nr:hypothetical protein IMSHALPRED_002431 [Imshaugia aleurites]
MFLRNAPLLALSSGFITPATATPFQPTKDSAMKLSDTPNLVKPIFALNTSVLPVDSSGENTFNIRCDGETYGYNPNIVDCEGAKEYLLPDTTIWTWAERHTGLPNTVPLPYRIMGDRALCYIQATLIGDHRTAQASTNMLRQAGAALVLRCATNTVSQGGIATEIGGDGNLAAVLGTYHMPVSCRGTLASWHSCRSVLFDMSADSSPQVFGPSSDPAVTQDLPFRFVSSDYKCAVNLFTTGQSDVATFYDIWQAATAIFAVCGRYGKGGSVRGLGDLNPKLQVAHHFTSLEAARALISPALACANTILLRLSYASSQLASHFHAKARITIQEYEDQVSIEDHTISVQTATSIQNLELRVDVGTSLTRNWVSPSPGSLIHFKDPLTHRNIYSITLTTHNPRAHHFKPKYILSQI